jgi:hypothetical protein
MRCHPINVFVDNAYIFINKLTNVDIWPKIQNESNIHHPLVFKILIQQQNKWKVKHVFITQSCHPPTFLLLAMDEYIVSF